MPSVADAAVQILLQLVFCQAGIRKKRIKWCAVHVPIADAIFRRFTASSYSDDPFKNVVAYKLADDLAIPPICSAAFSSLENIRYFIRMERPFPFLQNPKHISALRAVNVALKLRNEFRARLAHLDSFLPVDDLLTPPVEYSMESGENQPFSEYTIEVNADGYEEINISGIDVFSGETSIQNVYLNEDNREIPENNIVIPVNTLYGSYPAKIPETEIKPVRQSGEIVLSRVVIPETIVVHDGVPTDSTALDYYVRYKDYIKNVASSEIYSTWPRQTLEANILAIMSFTLNRVYTEWYRNQNYNFTITSSTAFDHKWVNGRNIFESISQVVDEIFDNYLSRPNVKQPILTQYCDGKKSSCPDWMTQ